jgi:hypothetical protein
MRKTEMELKDTVELMNSADYKDRFKAEYWQNQLRYEKLHDMVIKYEAGTLNFTPTCDIELLKKQKSYMGQYLYYLELRAEIEGIDLKGVDMPQKDIVVAIHGRKMPNNCGECDLRAFFEADVPPRENCERCILTDWPVDVNDEKGRSPGCPFVEAITLK